MMKKNILTNQKGNTAIIIAVLVLILGVSGFLLSKNSKVQDDVMMHDSDSMMADNNHDSNDAMVQDDKMMNDEKDGAMKDDDKMMQDDNSNGDKMMDDKTDDTMMNDSDSMMADNNHDSNDAMVQDDKMMNSEPGEFIDYSQSAYNNAKGKTRVLFFAASWCPTCKQAEKEILANAGDIPSDVVILKTDYDKEIELKKKYNITYQHTFVQVDDNGNEIVKWNGGAIDELKQKIK